MDESTPNVPAVEDETAKQERIKRGIEERTAPYRFKKGQSGNPKGRPKAESLLSDFLRKELKKKVPGDIDGRTLKELIVRSTIAQAMKGNKAALAILWDRAEGKVQDELKVSGVGQGGAILHQVEVAFLKGDDGKE